MILNINEAHCNNDIQAHDEIKLVVGERLSCAWQPLWELINFHLPKWCTQLFWEPVNKNLICAYNYWKL